MLIFNIIKDASKRRRDDIEANQKGVQKRSSTIKLANKVQKRTAIVKPLPSRKLQKSQSENNLETAGSPGNERTKDKGIQQQRISNSLERPSNVPRFQSPQRMRKKQSEIKCEYLLCSLYIFMK